MDRDELLRLARVEEALVAHILKQTRRAKGEAATLANTVAYVAGIRAAALRALAGDATPPANPE